MLKGGIESRLASTNNQDDLVFRPTASVTDVPTQGTQIARASALDEHLLFQSRAIAHREILGRSASRASRHRLEGPRRTVRLVGDALTLRKGTGVVGNNLLTTCGVADVLEFATGDANAQQARITLAAVRQTAQSRMWESGPIILSKAAAV